MAMKGWTDIYGPQKKYPTDFGDFFSCGMMGHIGKKFGTDNLNVYASY